MKTDWKHYVRSHLPPLAIRAERESEIVDELALQLEAAYVAALARGATEAEARARARGEVGNWAALAETISRIERPVESRLARRQESVARIVGVVRDVKTTGVDRPADLQVYLPLAQTPSTAIALVARAIGNAASLASAVESAIHQVDSNLPVYDVRTLNDVIGRGVGQQRLTMVLLLGFAALPLLMAAVGVFGVTAYAVSQRTHEFGVRMALGATHSGVLRLVLRDELTACAIGIVVGIVGALALSSSLETLVYGVAPRDPSTLAIVSIVLVAVTGLAGYFPARRATHIDPVRALRID